MCRRILFCPKDRKAIEFSVYLEAADWATLPDGWSINAKFRLSVVNVKQGNVVSELTPFNCDNGVL